MTRGKARSRYLPAGTTLHGATGKSWTIQAAETWKGLRLATPPWVIGAGGFGVTYRVIATPGGEVMALKEYFPEDFAERAHGGGVEVRGDDNGATARLFAEGLRKFANEAQYLQELKHPNICRVVDAFMANGTAYYVSELVDGRAVIDEDEGRIHRRVTLHDYLAEVESSGAPLTLAQVRPLVDQLLDAVDYVHTEGPAVVLRVLGFETRTLLHRDIKPSNILVRPAPEKLDASATEVLTDPNTIVQLIDFGSARGMAVDEGDGHTKSVAFITDSYAPPELKDNRISEQGPQSDIYSLAATFWRVLIGRQPAMTDLIGGARAVNMGEGRAPPVFLAGLDSALQMDAKARPQSVSEWRNLLFRREPKKPSALEAAARRPVYWAAAAGVLIVAAGGIWGLGQLGGPTGHIYREADRVYQAALIDVATAEEARLAAQANVDRSSAAADFGFEASNQAAENLSAKERAESPVMIRNTLLNVYDEDNNYSYYSWCTPDPNGDVTQTYTRRRFRCSRSLGAVTEVPGGTYTGPTSPWRIEVGTSTFEGHVDAETPKTAGVLRNSDSYLALTIQAVDGSTVTGLGSGQISVSEGVHLVAGKITAVSGEQGLAANRIEGSIDHWPDRETSLVGRWTTAEAVGSFKRGDAVTSIGRRSGSGNFSGRIELDGGRTFVGSRPSDGLWWGALLRSGAPYYLGQVKDGVPDGCGVRIGENGRRRGVYLSNGLEDPDAFRAACRKVTADGAVR